VICWLLRLPKVLNSLTPSRWSPPTAYSTVLQCPHAAHSPATCSGAVKLFAPAVTCWTSLELLPSIGSYQYVPAGRLLVCQEHAPMHQCGRVYLWTQLQVEDPMLGSPASENGVPAS
jgi:hypothetical protein